MDLSAFTIYIGLGLGAGRSSAEVPEPLKAFIVGKTDTSSAVASAFAGARRGHFGIEGGLQLLPEYNARAFVADYPSYRRARLNETLTGPLSAAGTQKIQSWSYYARLNIYGWDIWRISPYAFYGRAGVRASNTEHAAYTAPDSTADFHINLYRSAEFYGGGLQGNVSGKWAVRAEIGFIPSAVNSHWTRERDVMMGTFNALLKW